jgi:hypothetical protein
MLILRCSCAPRPPEQFQIGPNQDHFCLGPHAEVKILIFGTASKRKKRKKHKGPRYAVLGITGSIDLDVTPLDSSVEIVRDGEAQRDEGSPTIPIPAISGPNVDNPHNDRTLDFWKVVLPFTSGFAIGPNLKVWARQVDAEQVGLAFEATGTARELPIHTYGTYRRAATRMRTARREFTRDKQVYWVNGPCVFRGQSTACVKFPRFAAPGVIEPVPVQVARIQVSSDLKALPESERTWGDWHPPAAQPNADWISCHLLRFSLADALKL